jgi:hypothetical protein
MIWDWERNHPTFCDSLDSLVPQTPGKTVDTFEIARGFVSQNARSKQSPNMHRSHTPLEQTGHFENRDVVVEARPDRPAHKHSEGSCLGHNEGSLPADHGDETASKGFPEDEPLSQASFGSTDEILCVPITVCFSSGAVADMNDASSEQGPDSSDDDVDPAEDEACWWGSLHTGGTGESINEAGAQDCEFRKSPGAGDVGFEADSAARSHSPELRRGEDISEYESLAARARAVASRLQESPSYNEQAQGDASQHDEEDVVAFRTQMNALIVRLKELIEYTCTSGTPQMRRLLAGDLLDVLQKFANMCANYDLVPAALTSTLHRVVSDLTDWTGEAPAKRRHWLEASDFQE